MEANGGARQWNSYAGEVEDVGGSSSTGDSSIGGRMDRLSSFDSNESTARTNNDMGKAVKTVNGTYHFTLTGYSFVRNLGAGNHISSGSFLVGGHEWAILFFPNGKSEEESKYVSIFITLLSDSYDVEALFQMTVLDRSGNGNHCTPRHFEGQEGQPHVLRSQGSMWGFKRFIRREAFEQSDLLKDDAIELTGRVGVLSSSVKPARLPTPKASPISPSPSQRDLRDRSGGEADSAQDLKGDGSQPESPSTDSREDASSRRRYEDLQLLEDRLARYFHDVRKATHQYPVFMRERHQPDSLPAPQGS